MNTPVANNILVLGPVFIPLLGAFLCLALARSNRMQRYIGLAAGLGSWLTSVLVLLQNWQITQNNQAAGTVEELAVQVYRLGAWDAPFGIVLVADMLSALFAVMATTVVAGGILYAVSCKDKCTYYPAFMPAFLGMATGLSGSFYTGDIFTLFVFLELMVISSVILVAVSDNKLGLEAAIKYLLISAMGTLFLLVGIAAVYATFGTLNMADMARLLETGERPLLARAAAVMLAAAFLLKSAVFPFHYWQPDFHTTAPTPVHSVLSSVVVKVGVYGLIRLVTMLFTEEAAVINDILIVLGIIGIFFGSLGALRTYDAKRMLAYSTFGQIGFILVGIGWGTPLAMLAAIVYAFNHAFIKSALLMLTGVVSSRNKWKSAKIVEIAGVARNMYFVGLLYFLGGLALAGVPPLNGFISKLVLVRGGIEAESWLALGLVVGGGVITLLYMTRTYVLMFQQKPNENTAPLKAPGQGDAALAPAILIGITVLLGLYATPLIDVAQMTVEQLYEPGQYIIAVLGV
ncbi:MAG: complex I subunit 5 family protein [Chloroflexota bacterium]